MLHSAATAADAGESELKLRGRAAEAVRRWSTRRGYRETSRTYP